ncbi:MAG: family 2 glycosyl transferase [Parcubacteria group bacterium Gr01-1014_33]|nr:MAG: family 2 glycosyl transferase [Parcubacteria group bacterium Gr01-1014_33]
MIQKIDYAIAGLVGFFAGMFAIPTLVNLGFRDAVMLLAIPWIAAGIFVFGIWVSALLARKISFFAQFGKFAAVGVLNTVIDFGVLNLLSSAAGITTGLIVGGVNVPGFLVAVANSYFWNKLWVFKNKEKLFSDLPQFLAVTVGGLIVNSILVAGITTYISAPFGIMPTTWLNLAKAIATAFTLVWNFTGYKFLVFRQKTAVNA